MNLMILKLELDNKSLLKILKKVFTLIQNIN